MSLARTALRLWAVETLNADPAIDALCLGRVYDSRVGELSSTEAVPVITVFTEDDAGEAYSANNGGPPFDEKCELLLEIAMRATVPNPAGNGEPPLVGLVESDRQLEAMIDLLEHRAVRALTIADTLQAKLLRDAVTRRVTSFKSMRFVSDETNVKLAVRMVHLAVQLKGETPDDPRSPPTGAFAVLPNPLRTVAEAMPEGSSGRVTCQILVNAISGEGTTPVSTADIAPFSGTDITVAPRQQVDPGAPPTESAPGPHFGLKADPTIL